MRAGPGRLKVSLAGEGSGFLPSLTAKPARIVYKALCNE